MAYRMPDFAQHFEPVQWEQLEAFARRPGSTVNKVHDWIQALGITASKSAVHRWLKRFREEDLQSEAAELADAIHTANAGAGAVDVAGAVSLQLAQRLQAALVKGGKTLAIGDLLKGAMAVNALTNAQAKLTELKAKQAEALKAAEAAAKAGSGSVDVVALIKQKLGITA